MVIGGHSVIVNRLEVPKNFHCFLSFCSTICCIGVIIDDMSKKQMEKELNYGDCNNIFCFFDDLLERVSEKMKQDIDKKKNLK